MPDVVQAGVVNGLPHVLDGSLRVGWSDDLVLPEQFVLAGGEIQLQRCPDRQTVLPVGTFVGGQHSDLSPGHLLLVDGDSLADVVDLTLHLPDLGGLQVQHLQEVVGQGVDLVGHAGQTLGGVTLRLLQSCSLVVALREEEIKFSYFDISFGLTWK